MTKNIVLIGMMGSGKTMIAAALAKQLKVSRLSIDQMIEQKEKISIKDIVAKHGWEYFRALEHDMVRQVSKETQVVIDCGGGVVLNPENMDLLKENGIIFYLDAPPQVLYQRLKNDPHRPLIQAADPLAELERIYKERLPLYKRADHVIDTSDPSIDGPVVQILLQI